MLIEELQEICKKCTAVTEDIKWVNHLCFCVGKKMFLIIELDVHPTTASFKVCDDSFEEIIQKPGFIPAPYMARNKWVFVDDISRMNKIEWEACIKQSYQLIKVKLTKKLQNELGI